MQLVQLHCWYSSGRHTIGRCACNIERVQKKNHQDIGCTGSLQFKERLGLFSLGYGRHRGDLVEVYRILTGKHRIDSQNPFFKGRGRLELDEF